MARAKYINRPFQLKDMDAEKGKFTGYGSVFGEIDSYRDVVVKGAFAKSLKEDFEAKGRPVPMLWQHRSAEPIGIYTEIKEDDHGLYVEGEINLEVQQGREALALMKQKALSGLSIGYNTVDGEYKEESNLYYLREVKLWEISPVTFPAGDAARVDTVKSIDDLITLSDFEDHLREACGMTKSEALAFVARLRKADMRSESASPSLLKTLESMKTLTR